MKAHKKMLTKETGGRAAGKCAYKKEREDGRDERAGREGMEKKDRLKEERQERTL